MLQLVLRLLLRPQFTSLAKTSESHDLQAMQPRGEDLSVQWHLRHTTGRIILGEPSAKGLQVIGIGRRFKDWHIFIITVKLFTHSAHATLTTHHIAEVHVSHAAGVKVTLALAFVFVIRVLPSFPIHLQPRQLTSLLTLAPSSYLLFFQAEFYQPFRAPL